LAKYVANPDTSTLELVGGKPDITTWVWIFDILQDEQGPDVIFGVRTDFRDKLYVQVGDQAPKPLFDLSPNDMVSVCLIPGDNLRYAIVHLLYSSGKAWLYTNWKNPGVGLKLMCANNELFSFLPHIKANREDLVIFVDKVIYRLELADLPDDYNKIFELKQLNSKLKGVFYLVKVGLHFNKTTKMLSSEKTKYIADVFKLPNPSSHSLYFLVLSNSFMIPRSQNKDILLFFVTKVNEEDTIINTSFSLPTATTIWIKTSYPFVCWSVWDGAAENIYLFVISPKYPNYTILVLANPMFSYVGST
jgi:hypothetical protein